MDFIEETLSSKKIYDGKIIKVRVDKVRLPGGKESSREVVEHSGGVTIIPINKNNEILLVEQYRKPCEEVLFELPAGKLEPGEEPKACAERELIEETGFKAGKLEYLFSFYTSPGFSNEILHLFVAKDLKQVGMNLDEDEIIQVHKITKEEIVDYIKSNKIKDGKTLLGLFYLLKDDFNV